MGTRGDAEPKLAEVVAEVPEKTALQEFCNMG
jgi:hypothetical protein